VNGRSELGKKMMGLEPFDMSDVDEEGKSGKTMLDQCNSILF